MSAVSRLNTFLNSSSDVRSLSTEKRASVDANGLWNDILQQNEEHNQRSSGDGLPLGRLLAQTYSYSSDSSSSPLAANTSRLSPPQISSRGSGVFSYSDDSPQSNGSSSSRQSFSYSSSSVPYTSRGFSDPGSPTLDDALLMGGLPDSPFSQNGSNSSKGKDLNLSDLMSSLSVTNNESSLCGGSSLLNGISGGHGGRHSSTSSHSALNGTSLLPQLNSNSTSALLTNSLGLNGGNHFSLGNNGSQSNLSNLSSGLNSLNSSHSLSQGMDLNSLAQLQNMWLTSRVLPNLDSPNLFGGMGDLRNSPNSPPLSPLPSIFSGSDPYAIEKAARMHRNAAALCDATCTWSGTLPTRVTKNPFYSCKVFLGGVPWDVTELALRQAFLQFGSIQVEWPGKENSANPPKGYVYVLFENEKQVKSLLASCTQNFNSENYYFKISSRRMRQKEVQVIPWVISDSNYVRCPSYQLDPAKTVFVGALHGMLSAEGLANIMNDLFGGVVYSGIDTDKHKYPIGSGRVTFNNVLSYRKAVRAAFIEIKTLKFTKKVQVDPYLADSPCQLCGSQQGPYFCRDENCFRYYCRSCWQITHSGEVNTHKPLMRDPKLRSQTTINRLI